MNATNSFRLSNWLLSLFTLLAGFSPLAASGVVTSYERKIIASVLVLEAANQGDIGMRAVLHVINNRANGKTEHLIGQVARKKAFSCLNKITAQKNPDYGPAIAKAMKDQTWDHALELVDRLLSGTLGQDPTGGATHYCIDPPHSWIAQMVYLKRIGAHTFFKEV